MRDTGGGMHDPVDSFRTAVEFHIPTDDREAEAKQTILVELNRLRHPFDEAAGPVHVTGSGVVVGSRGVILLKHRRLHRWMQPGGHIEPGERPEQAAVRECREETGLLVDHPPAGPIVIHLDVHDAARGHTHLDVRYLIVAPDTDPSPPHNESQEIDWFSWDDAAATADDSLQGALRRARTLVEMPGRPGESDRFR